jgi:excinuclease ABC subunit A
MSLVIPDREKTLREGAIAPWTFPRWKENLKDLLAVASGAGVRVDVPFRELSQAELNVILNGCRGFDGILKFFRYIERKSYKVHYRVFLSRYRSYTTCDECGGARLRPAARLIRVGEKGIHEIVGMTIDDAAKFFRTLTLSDFEYQVARRILDELRKRLTYLVDVGIGYLTLDRLTGTLSGGESQRINLSTALGSSLVGSLYVLDEPSIGLHPRDTQKLIGTIRSLRDVGNTVIVVEHDSEMMDAADVIVDMGPRAGEFGGEVVAQGTFAEIMSRKDSLTGRYLSGEAGIPVPSKRRTAKTNSLVIRGAAANNLKGITVGIPLNRFVCVTGVSGSGKSTLVHDILTPALRRRKGEESVVPGEYASIEGDEQIDAVELVDQSPIGKSPRSNPATYIKVFDLIRDLLARTPAAKIHGTKPGYFSFNVPGGRCEACEGSGIQTIEMQFLADLELRCEVCQGKRFSKEVLAIRYHGKNVDDILQMTVAEAMTFFGEHPTGKRVVQQLGVLAQVGMGYIRLGQSATTLSGGEAQRVKLASHLAGQQKGVRTLFVFDEPTTGLHVDDIAKLLECFNGLIASGNSVLIIEHNMEVIKCADWIIDLGPEAGEGGGRVVGAGVPEDIVRLKGSHTGRYLKRYL